MSKRRRLESSSVWPSVGAEGMWAGQVMKLGILSIRHTSPYRVLPYAKGMFGANWR